MKRRGYHPDETWYNACWRGKNLGEQFDWVNEKAIGSYLIRATNNGIIYHEHDDKYLQECIDNLKEKGIEINGI